MIQPKKPPTARLIARQVTALMRSIKFVYGDRGQYVDSRTTELGTMRIEWFSGQEVLRGKIEDKPEGGVYHG